MRLTGLLLLFLLGTSVPARGQDQTQQPYRAIKGFKIANGEELPDFSSPKSVKSYRGKPLLINFYSANCPPCLREIPKLNALQHLNPDLQVLAITPDSVEEATDYSVTRRLAWPIATPGQDYLFITLGVQAFPTFAILDAEGKLLSATYGNQLGGEDGHATLAGISNWVESVLRKKLN